MKKAMPDSNDPREQLWVEEAYLMYLNNYAFDAGLISDSTHHKMIRKIKERTHESERRMKEPSKKRTELER